MISEETEDLGSKIAKIKLHAYEGRRPMETSTPLCSSPTQGIEDKERMILAQSSLVLEGTMCDTAAEM